MLLRAQICRLEIFFELPSGPDLILDVGALTQYRAVSASTVQPGDRYLFSINAFNSRDSNSSTSIIDIDQTIAAGGAGPVTIEIPDPLSYSGPTPAPFPKFALNYAPASAFSTARREVAIVWPTSNKFGADRISLFVSATNSYLHGSTAVPIPDLSAVPGFFAPAHSGTVVQWGASVTGTDPNGATVSVTNRGTYIEP